MSQNRSPQSGGLATSVSKMIERLPSNPSQLALAIAWVKSELVLCFSPIPRLTETFSMAYHEMRLILTKVLYNFNCELCEESEGWLDQKTFTLWEKHPLMVKLRPVYS